MNIVASKIIKLRSGQRLIKIDPIKNIDEKIYPKVMDRTKIHPIKKSDKSHRVERPVQTGFSSPATHYNEPRIDLNEVLVRVYSKNRKKFPL